MPQTSTHKYTPEGSMGITEHVEDVAVNATSSPIVIRQNTLQSEETRSEAGSWNSDLSCFELPEGSPAFESIMRELSDQLESTSLSAKSTATSSIYDVDDDRIQYWCDLKDKKSTTGSTISFSEDTKPCASSDSELFMNSPDLNRTRTNSTGSPNNLSSKPPRPRLLQRAKSANPFVKRSILRPYKQLNKFPLRKSTTPPPAISPLLPRSKATQTMTKRTVASSNHQFKYVFQTVNISVSHDDLMLEKQEAERHRNLTSMFDDVHPCNPDLTFY